MIRRKNCGLEILASLKLDVDSSGTFEEQEYPTFSPALFKKRIGANLKIQKPILGKRQRVQSGESLSDGELENYEPIRKLKTPIVEPKLFFTRDMNFPGFARALSFGSQPKENSNLVTGFAYPASPILPPRKSFFLQNLSANENYCRADDAIDIKLLNSKERTRTCNE
jgi:hypothetical protein